MASPGSLAILELLATMMMISLCQEQPTGDAPPNIPSCDEPCACFGHFNDSNLFSLYPGRDDPSFTAYSPGLYVEVESRVLCGGRLISADFCVFWSQVPAGDVDCDWEVKVGLLRRRLDSDNYTFVDGDNVGIDRDDVRHGLGDASQCFRDRLLGDSAPIAEEGDLLVVQIQTSGEGCTAFPFYTTSDTSTEVYYQPPNDDPQLSPVPASSITNTSNHQIANVNARFHIETTSGCVCELSSTPSTTSVMSSGSGSTETPSPSATLDRNSMSPTTSFATSPTKNSALLAVSSSISPVLPLPSSSEENSSFPSSLFFSNTSSMALPTSSFSSNQAGSVTPTKGTDQGLPSPMVLPGSTADSVRETDSIREIMSPTPSDSFEPSRDLTIPTYGAVLAIIGTALLSLACVTLILVPIYLYKKNSRREIVDVEVSRHSDRSAPSSLSAMASYQDPEDAIRKNARNEPLRLTIRNRIFSDNNHYQEEFDNEDTRDSEFTNGAVPFEEQVTNHSYAVLERDEEVPRRKPSLPPRAGDRFRTESDQQAKMQQYVAPASREDELKLQLRRLAVKEIRPDKLRVLNEELGSGQFGVVNKGVWSVGDEEREVAVKSLSCNSSEKRIPYLQEAAIMGQFKHPSIVSLYGVITASEPPMIVVEILPKGDLRKYLISLQPQAGQVLHPEYTGLLLSFCRQVAGGMTYLSTRGFVHRDLAARNILISGEDVCKIADFGMARHLQDKTHHRMSSTSKVPVRWTAPEVVINREYSSLSDVWSFGILMYEIWSLGAKPYSTITDTDEVLHIVNSGYRLPPPPGCPKQLYQIMMDCWNSRASVRPDFAKVLQSLQRPDLKLLKWTPEDVAAYSEQARTLGAPLEAGEELFKELQILYLS